MISKQQGFYAKSFMSLVSQASLESDNNIPVPANEPSPKQRLKGAYLCERSKLEVVEVELNRSKVLMIDQNGKFMRVSFFSEH